MKPIRHKIISALFSIAFVVVTQWFAVPIPIFRFLVPAFVVYLLVLGIYNWRYLKTKQEFSWWLLIRLPIFIFIWFGLLFIIPAGFARSIFLLGSLPVIFFFETLVANKGQQIGWNLFLLSLACMLIALFGFNFYFPLHGLVYLGLIFLGVLILVRVSVDSVPHEPRVKWLASLILGLFAAELFWALQFLPLHFSALAILCFTGLYLLWTIYYHYLYQTLNSKQIQLNILLVMIVSMVILLVTPWGIQS